MLFLGAVKAALFFIKPVLFVLGTCIFGFGDYILFEKIFDDAIYFHEQKKPLVGGFF